jgi:histidinol-phosphatase (PHP family)
MPRFWTNYHSHSHYCDGTGSPEAQVLAARQQGIRAFGFSSHAPVPFANAWSMQPERLEAYLAETAALREQYRGELELYQGLEVDYIPGVCGPADFAGRLDYTIGSVHYLGTYPDGTPWEIDGSTEGFLRGLTELHGGEVQAVIRQYYAQLRQMVSEDCPDVVGHLDKIRIHDREGSLYDEQADWYRQEVEHTLEVIAAAGCIVEVNTRGVYKKKLGTYPSDFILQRIKEKQIPVMLNADSHAPEEITAAFGETAARLKCLGFRTLRVLLQQQWQDIPFDENGLISA